MTVKFVLESDASTEYIEAVKIGAYSHENSHNAIFELAQSTNNNDFNADEVMEIIISPDALVTLEDGIVALYL
jgi:hypothetical protein